jgi:indolepyruvate ferredoxin oxidoreductase, beta subunit
MNKVNNIVIAGLGGQGVLKASDILADAAFRAGYDVKKSELHGMSQRGGSVSSDVRFGEQVWSPMVPTGEADVLVVLEESQVEVNRQVLRPDGVLIGPDLLGAEVQKIRKSLNVALLGALSTELEIAQEHWDAAIHANLAPKLHKLNEQAFAMGRAAAA